MQKQQVLPEAFYDSLYIAFHLDDVLDGFKFEEIHLFSYFSSILFLQKKVPLADWQYKFTTDKQGYPFSVELQSAVDRHLLNGLFEQKGEYFYSITARGAGDLEKFKRLENFSVRDKYLNAACATTIMIPYSQKLRALLKDPEIDKNRMIKGERWLDQNDAYTKFKELSLAVGIHTDDLIIPAVTWVNYINKKHFDQD